MGGRSLQGSNGINVCMACATVCLNLITAAKPGTLPLMKVVRLDLVSMNSPTELSGTLNANTAWPRSPSMYPSDASGLAT